MTPAAHPLARYQHLEGTRVMNETPYRAYPLQWPSNRPRRPPAERCKGRFKSNGKRITIHAATERLKAEIGRLGGTLPVVSTNIEPRRDGLPRSDGRPLNDDPGVCLYFQLNGEPHALSLDKYITVEDNLAAIAAHIDASRLITRHGVGSVKQVFAGFRLLRGPGERPWREVLGIRPDEPVTPQLVLARRAELAKQHHPDVGGSHAMTRERRTGGGVITDALFRKHYQLLIIFP